MHKNLKFIVNAESLKVLFSLERFKKASQKRQILRGDILKLDSQHVLNTYMQIESKGVTLQ